MSIVDDYLANLSNPQKQILNQVRKIVDQVVPDAQEVITYGMPGYKYKGKYLIAFAVFKNHMSIFPGAEPVEVLKSKLTKYKTSKGTVQFTVDNPLTDEIITELLNIRLSRI